MPAAALGLQCNSLVAWLFFLVGRQCQKCIAPSLPKDRLEAGLGRGVVWVLYYKSIFSVLVWGVGGMAALGLGKWYETGQVGKCRHSHAWCMSSRPPLVVATICAARLRVCVCLHVMDYGC